jgi:hypothetical protein
MGYTGFLSKSVEKQQHRFHCHLYFGSGMPVSWAFRAMREYPRSSRSLGQRRRARLSILRCAESLWLDIGSRQSDSRANKS